MIDADLKSKRRQQFEDGLLPERALEESSAELSQSELDEVGLEFQFFSENRALTALEFAEGLYFEPSFARFAEVFSCSDWASCSAPVFL